MRSERNLFKRGAIWWVRATIDGNEYRESLRTRDVKIARKRRDEKLASFESTRDGKPQVSWREAVAAWTEHEIGQIGPATAKRYGVSLTQCEKFLGPLKIVDITGKTIADMIASRQKAGATAATIRRDLTAVSRVLTYAEAREWREGNPTLSKRKLLKERRDPIVLPEEEAIASVVSAATPRFAAMIVAARLTGCRQDELVNAEWKMFNARSKTLEVIGKGNKRRTLSLSDEATAHFSSQPRALVGTLIFCRDDGEPFAQAASNFTHFRRKAEAVAKRQGKSLRRFRFHDLRHLYAVEALRAGMGIYDLKDHLGHTSVKTTETVYLAFLTPDEAKRAKGAPAQNAAQPRRSSVVKIDASG